MAAGYPSGSNVFVPSFDASGQIIVNYSRNPKDFAVNQYTTLTPVKKSSGYYLRITAEQAARVLQSNLSDRIWHDGNDAPNLTWGNESFEFKPFTTERFVYGFRLGYKAVEQADWKILASHAAIAAQSAMTARTVYALSKLTTTSNYDSTHTATATALAGGKFDVGTVASPNFKEGLLAAAEVILKDTLGVVQPKDLVLVMNPTDARLISSSDELMDQFKHSQFSWPWAVEGKEVVSGNRSGWGLPPTYAGFKIIIDDTVKVTSAKGETRAASYALPSGTMLLIARPGTQVGLEGSVSYSTGHFFNYEEMTVESRDDPDNRRHLGRIIDDFGFEIVAPASGFVITAATA